METDVRLMKRRRQELSSSAPNTSECRRIESVEDLESYVKEEDCVFVAIKTEHHTKFAEKGFFRALAKNHKKILATTRWGDYEIPDDARRYVLRGWDSLDSDLQDLIKAEAVAYHNFTSLRKYDDMSIDECLRLLGDSHGVMVSFETVGHIAHLNLPVERLWAKKIIAKILLDKHKHIKTVVNKVREVDNEFRTMELELLGGVDDLVAVQHENSYTFKIDFRNVYWNSRLIQERERISDTFHMGDVLVDMFAGVGPFAMYAAGKGCLVFANDLNPVGAQFIGINAGLNNVTHLVHPYNLDAREFAKTVVEYGILDRDVSSVKDHKLRPESKIHFVMNLPKDAIEFMGTPYSCGDNSLQMFLEV
ncbi:tRNA (guanine(37)-N1)-methyltransferase [Babesia ovata]|uniref:tRNA (Guanine(37)-N1)-methyltransferase n=1 Tax=Babesia ovata TaxID=189622 RepID=A0A2H6KJ88_9APIC|nr:tRNA (guanine(37)-N1)-methyltransferase [Babesia ovata]GBE63050.1 tRNA (guanine(37)-N1)-methyltransferase [Babesia ovata]